MTSRRLGNVQRLGVVPSLCSAFGFACTWHIGRTRKWAHQAQRISGAHTELRKKSRERGRRRNDIERGG